MLRGWQRHYFGWRRRFRPGRSHRRIPDPVAFEGAALGEGIFAPIEDFESFLGGSSVPDGSLFGGGAYTLTNAGTAAGFDFGIIDSAAAATSGSNSLGFFDGAPGFYLSGDDIVLTPTGGSLNAVGMFIITSPGDAGFADDLILSGGGASISNALAPSP